MSEEWARELLAGISELDDLADMETIEPLRGKPPGGLSKIRRQAQQYGLGTNMTKEEALQKIRQSSRLCGRLSSERYIEICLTILEVLELVDFELEPDTAAQPVAAHQIMQPSASDPYWSVRVIDRPTAIQLSGVSDRTFDRIEAAGKGPIKTRLSERRIGYRLIDFEQWLARRGK